MVEMPNVSKTVDISLTKRIITDSSNADFVLSGKVSIEYGACKVLAVDRLWTWFYNAKEHHSRSEKRWQCMDQSKLRKCGKAKCSIACEDENRGKPKSHYGLPSVWRQKECLTCLIKVSF